MLGFEFRSNPTPFVAAEEVLCLCILEGTACDEVHPYQQHHCHYQNHIGFSPILSEVPQQPSLARIAIVAQLALVIAPQVAVRIPRWVHRV